MQDAKIIFNHQAYNAIDTLPTMDRSLFFEFEKIFVNSWENNCEWDSFNTCTQILVSKYI